MLLSWCSYQCSTVLVVLNLIIVNFVWVFLHFSQYLPLEIRDQFRFSIWTILPRTVRTFAYSVYSFSTICILPVSFIQDYSSFGKAFVLKVEGPGFYYQLCQLWLFKLFLLYIEVFKIWTSNWKLQTYFEPLFSF